MSSTPERRELSFASLNDVVAEAERLASGEVRTTGNHSFGQILEHLARTHDLTTGKLEGPRPPHFCSITNAVNKIVAYQKCKTRLQAASESRSLFLA